MPKRTYIDTCLLIAAFKGEGELGRRALSVLATTGVCPSRSVLMLTLYALRVEA